MSTTTSTAYRQVPPTPLTTSVIIYLSGNPSHHCSVTQVSLLWVHFVLPQRHQLDRHHRLVRLAHDQTHAHADAHGTAPAINNDSHAQRLRITPSHGTMGKPVLYYYDGKRGEAEAIRMMFKEMGEVRYTVSKASFTPYLAPLDGHDQQRPACKCQFPPARPRTGLALPTTTSTMQLSTHLNCLHASLVAPATALILGASQTTTNCGLNQCHAVTPVMIT